MNLLKLVSWKIVKLAKPVIGWKWKFSHQTFSQVSLVESSPNSMTVMVSPKNFRPDIMVSQYHGQALWYRESISNFRSSSLISRQLIQWHGININSRTSGRPLGLACMNLSIPLPSLMFFLLSLKGSQTLNFNQMEYWILEVYGPSGPRLLAGGPSGLLTSSFAPFGRSGRVTHASVIG